jgi:hypothetical protein
VCVYVSDMLPCKVRENGTCAVAETLGVVPPCSSPFVVFGVLKRKKMKQEGRGHAGNGAARNLSVRMRACELVLVMSQRTK